MSKQLTIDEMLDCASLLRMPERAHYKSEIERLGTELAQLLAARLGVNTDRAVNENSEVGGTCAPFTPATKGQTCPYPLNLFDVDEWEVEDGGGAHG